MPLINRHDYRPTPKFFGTPHLGTFYGVELELDVKGHVEDNDPYTTEAAQATQDLLGDFVYLKHDGSIKGFEIVTHPASLQVHRNRWKKFFSSIPESLHATTKDGMHVHFSKAGLSRHQIWQIHNFINSQTRPAKPKPPWYFDDAAIAGIGGGPPWLKRLAGRNFVHYCRKVVKPEATVLQATIHGKYEAVNTCPKSTVEVRLFASTTKYEEFMLRLEFTAAMVQAVQQAVDPLTLASLKSFLASHPKRFPTLVAWLAKEKEI